MLSERTFRTYEMGSSKSTSRSFIMMTKKEILDGIESVVGTTARNRMGCNESWYNSYYAIRQTFGIDRCKKMSEKELNLLVELADSMSDAFY